MYADVSPLAAYTRFFFYFFYYFGVLIGLNIVLAFSIDMYQAIVRLDSKKEKNE
jgi:hypothetical protein